MTFYKCETCGLITSEMFKKCPSCGIEALMTKVLIETEDIQIPCSHCGCYESIADMKDGMCDDCYEDYLEDCKEDEED